MGRRDPEKIKKLASDLCEWFGGRDPKITFADAADAMMVVIVTMLRGGSKDQEDFEEGIRAAQGDLESIARKGYEGMPFPGEMH